MMEAVASESSKRTARRLRRGEVIDGTVVQIGTDAVFVDIGGIQEARIERSQLLDADGKLKVGIGDRVAGTVIDARMESPVMAISLGRDGLDLGMLHAAVSGGSPVRGTVSKALKAGLEVEIGAVRAFCPASQIDLNHVPDLAVFEGQELEFRVIEVRDGGRSVVVSRRALLEARREEAQKELRERLVPGSELEGVVQGTHKHGLVVDLGGIEGFVHISEIAHHRVDRIEDAASVGDTIRVSVLGVEETGRHLRVRLSMKALLEAPARPEAPQKDEILNGVVSRSSTFGVFVQTDRGEGLVPLKELGLAPGADHRRAYPVGKPLTVALVHRDPSNGKMRFSVTQVANVEERSNYKAFSASGTGNAGPTRSLGSLGDVFGEKLKLAAAAAQKAAPPAASPKAAPPAAKKAAALAPTAAPGAPKGAQKAAPAAPAPAPKEAAGSRRSKR